MRLTCPCCGKRFDVPYRAILAEAAKLNGHRLPAAATPAPRPAGPDADGNTLDAADPEAVKARRQAIARRMNKVCGKVNQALDG